jgi:hypothetical protein
MEKAKHMKLIFQLEVNNLTIQGSLEYVLNLKTQYNQTKDPAIQDRINFIYKAVTKMGFDTNDYVFKSKKL